MGAIAAAVPGGGPAAKIFDAISSNPFLAFYIPAEFDEPENMHIRCSYMAQQASLQSNSLREDDPLDTDDVALKPVTSSYEAYKYYQKVIDNAEELMETLELGVNRAIPARDLDYELEMTIAGATEEQIVKSYFEGVTGLTGLTSWNSYFNLYNGVVDYLENLGVTGTSGASGTSGINNSPSINKQPDPNPDEIPETNV
jgi:hypothetical protein